ncbi:hypothetical protein [Methylobacterium soli]|uniref:Uncharacterized protein n=1 Tax=Methylobacterium soli TaxID=553447 RepID=A0A6L3T2E3_9HYPH|nr:hypothetical protein [Methylobacterium soli]KAB1080701.1 hypothetical protein F6X53_05880 [Methylobacterium soli]GJE42281.1 hypothetical protein AEGHOMDF_1453 [Methylobacterium soli]
MFRPKSLPSRSARRPVSGSPARRSDHSIAVIVFMMALVFVPVLGMHVAVATFGSENPGTAVTALADRVALLLNLGQGAPG